MASNFLCDAVEALPPSVHNSRMAPRSKNVAKELRRPTYIKAWRKHRGLTLEGLVDALAYKAGYEISDGQLSRVERGVSPYTQDLLEAIASVLGVELYVLLRNPPRDPGDDEPEDIVHDMTQDQRRQAIAILRALKTGT